MKTKILFATILLALSVGCLTANEFSPYYPEHLYGDVVLDSVVIPDVTEENHILFDEKGRMVAQTAFDFDAVTQQWKQVADLVFTYDENGIFYIATTQRVWNSDKNEWEEYKFKLDEVIYTNNGYPVEFNAYVWNNQTQTWDFTHRLEYQYDENGRCVLQQYYVWSEEEQKPLLDFTTTVVYELDAEGRVIKMISTSTSKSITEYTYNPHGDIVTEKNFYQPEGMDPHLTSTVLYSYNELCNPEKRITLDGENTVREEAIYYYHLPTGVDEIYHKSEIINDKFIHNGQLFILRDNHTYTVTGQEVR